MEYVPITKVCEIVVPKTMLLNDNIQNSYKINMGKMKWLADQAKMAIEDPNNPKCVCWICDKDFDLPPQFNRDKFAMIVSHFKCSNQKFDLANYERTVKPIIDVMVGNGYFTDDNHNNLNPIIFIGGDKTNWKDNNSFGIEDPIYDEENLEDYFKKVVPDHMILNTRASKLKKISDFDVFQLYVFSF